MGATGVSGEVVAAAVPPAFAAGVPNEAGGVAVGAVGDTPPQAANSIAAASARPAALAFLKTIVVRD